MITYVKGNIFDSSAQCITNPINCVGVMGGGLALQFKKYYPTMFSEYKKKCDRNEVLIGIPYIWDDGDIKILNFPTKRHWRDDSRLEDIEDGLRHLANNYVDMGIKSIALPLLGCGLGGLKRNVVLSLIEQYLNKQDLEVFIYDILSI